ncbi:hypothetical protein [Amycolatopsis pithecellobii]|nr:hypothetical protein [Amycolatopsis pithecellobii]
MAEPDWVHELDDVLGHVATSGQPVGEVAVAPFAAVRWRGMMG